MCIQVSDRSRRGGLSEICIQISDSVISLRIGARRLLVPGTFGTLRSNVVKLQLSKIRWPIVGLEEARGYVGPSL